MLSSRCCAFMACAARTVERSFSPVKTRVLIVDDEPLARERTRSLLEALPDIECVGECADGVSAVAAIRKDAPDIVLLDVQMPELDGFQFLEELRWQPAWQNTPVFIWTSMQLSDADYSRLARSASLIVGKGAGSIDQLLGRLREFAPDRRPDH